MKCPIDGIDLVITERSGVEIDYCPTCRGVWLDRGELDKILERTGAAIAPPQSRDDRGRSYGEKRHKKNKATDFLGELFDF